VFGLGIGPVPVSLTWKDKDLSFAWMTAAPTPPFSENRLRTRWRRCGGWACLRAAVRRHRTAGTGGIERRPVSSFRSWTSVVRSTVL